MLALHMLVLLLLACLPSPQDSGAVRPELVLPAGALATVTVSRSLDGQVVSGSDDPASLCPDRWLHAGYDGLYPVCVSPEPGASVAITHRADGTPLNLDDRDACSADFELVAWQGRRAWCYRAGAATVLPVSRLVDGVAVDPGQHSCPEGYDEVGALADRAFCAAPGVRAVYVLGGVGTEALPVDALHLAECPPQSTKVGFLGTRLVCVSELDPHALELTRSPEGTSLAAADGDPALLCPQGSEAVGFRSSRALCSLSTEATTLVITRDLDGIPRVSGENEGRICPASTIWVGGLDSAVVCLSEL